MPASPDLKKLCYVRKHQTPRFPSPGWYVVTVKVPTDENIGRAWKALAACAPAEVVTAPGSLRFVRFD
jgi:hypothetical protein